MTSKFLTVFEMPELKHVHLNKDVGQIGYHISKMYGLTSEILTLEANEECIKSFKQAGLNVIKPNFKFIIHLQFLKIFLLYFKLILIAHEYKNIMFFHNRPSTLFINVVLCKLNPTLSTYLKLDLDLHNERYLIELFQNSQSRFRSKVYSAFLKYSFNCFKCVSVESERAFNKLKPLIPNLVHIRNGAAETYFRANCSVERSSRRIAVVGRLSDPQKNISYMLDVIQNLSIRNLTFVMVGHTSPKIRMKALSVAKSKARDKIKIDLKGELICSTELLDIYDSCSLLMSTSLFEGFPLSYCEASARGLFILTTKVGCEGDFIANGMFGKVLPASDARLGARFIDELFEKNIVNEELNNQIKHRSSLLFRWEKIVPNLWEALNG